MWLAALGGRLAVVVRRISGHVVARETAPRDPAQPATSLFDGLQQLLRLSTECPSGPAGDDIRRAACELIEANSAAARHTGRRRMLKAIAGVERRRSRGRSRDDDPNALTVGRLTDALRRKLHAE